MKIILFILIVVVCSCDHPGEKKVTIIDRKSYTVMAVYDTGRVGRPVFILGFLQRVIIDTLKYYKIDDNTLKKKSTKDTSYFIFMSLPIRDSVGNIIKGVSGKDSANEGWVNVYNKRIVMDGGKVDSAIKNYKQ